ncbi:MAG TPA: sulfotransferase [Candidatus Eremiobacteraceae bacterium]
MNPVVRNILTKHFIDSNGDPNAAVLLACSGRSGSTWVSRVINYRNDFRMMFEPFREDLIPECIAFRLNQYIRPNDRSPEFLQPAKVVLAGRVRHDWIDRYNRRFFCQRRLVKDIRVNLFLKWLCVNFPHIPVVMLMRHPCAVALSRMALSWDMDLQARFLSQPALVEDYLAPFAGEMARAGTEWERQIFAWCVENYVPLAQCVPNDVHLTFYEDFCRAPEAELGKFAGFLRVRFDDHVRKEIATPSQTVRTNLDGQGYSSIVSGDDVVGGWRREVSPQQIKRAVEIVRMFGLDRIYGEEPMPLPDAKERAFIPADQHSSMNAGLRSSATGE